MAQFSTCYDLRCGQIEPGTVSHCPRCGGRMRPSRTVRRLGAVMLACGLFLIGLMGWITWSMSWALLHPGQDTVSGRFEGTADDARTIINLFALVIGFGVAAAAAGLWQMITGRRNRWIAIGALALAGVLYFFVRTMKLSG